MKTSTQWASWLSRWLDKRHLDPLIGLVLPEVGDLLSTAAGLSVVLLAWRDGAPWPVLARMTLNLAIDGIVGAVPILGDLFDLVFKAHTRNATLLQAREARRATAWDYAILVLSLFGLVAALALPIVGLVSIIWWLQSAFER